MKETKKGMDAGKALETLLDGNRRFIAGLAEHPNLSANRRLELKQGQNPFAVILSCSDSRVAPEHVFDQGLGDLFVVRVAGNVLDEIVLGSVEYAVIHLNVSLILVLGHSSCGAVSAALKGEGEGHVPSIISKIRPVIEKTRDIPGDPVENSVKENARMVARDLTRASGFLNELVDADRLRIVPAFYDIGSGNVDILR